MPISPADTMDSIPRNDWGEPDARSPAELRFDRARQAVGLLLGPAAFLGMWVLPLGVSEPAHRLASVVALVVVWWISEAIPIPMTALLGCALMAPLGITSAPEAFAPFASPVVFLIVGSFMIGRAISDQGLDRRVALALLSAKQVRGSLERIRLAMLALCIVISAWMSNTATVAMLVPIALGILSSAGALRAPDARPYTSGFLLLLAYGSAVGGLLTPIGSPPNLVAIGLLDRLAGVRIDFATWTMLTAPIAATLGLAIYVMADRLFPRASVANGHARLEVERPAGALTPGQRHCLAAFGVAVFLWLMPGVYALVGPGAPAGLAVISRLDEGVVALLAAGLLFVLPVDWPRRRFALEWTSASRIDWGTILLFGGGLSLGHQMFQTGLAERLGTVLAQTTGAESQWGVAAMAIALGIVMTEITSNTAATNMIVPVVISISEAAGLNPVPAALGTCIGASMAFMLPISTPPNAIVYGTGRVRITEMIRYGIFLDVIGFLIALAGLRIMCPLLGLA